MTLTTINDGDSGATVRSALNANFTENAGNIKASAPSHVHARDQIGDLFDYNIGSTTWDPGNLADDAQEAKDITVTGAALGDLVIVSFSLDVQDLQLTGDVTTANTVTALLYNGTGGAKDLGSGTIKAMAIKT